MEPAFCLSSLSLLGFLFWLQLVWEFAIVVGVDGVCVRDCQNDSIVGWFDDSGVPLINIGLV